MIKNRTIFTRDNLEILRGMDDSSIDLVYLDPPFNSNRNYAAPVGSKAAGAAFKDTWTLDDNKSEWHGFIADEHPALHKILDGIGDLDKKDKAYLIYMSMRLIELQRIIKPSGSLYLHCDPTMSHGLKLCLDAVFGADNFRNEVSWSYRTGGISKRRWPRKHDVLLYYGKDEKQSVHIPLQERIRYAKPFFGAKKDNDGYYADVYVRDVWDDIPAVINVSKERTGYPTQKPLALLERIIVASSNENDIVLDPFCGCATTCIAAEKLKRQWIGVDISEKAADLVKERLATEVGITTKGSDNMLLPKGYVIHRTDAPKRTLAVLPAPYKIIKRRLYGEQQGVCNGCKKSFDFYNFEIDHIVPTSKGGQDIDENKQLLCGHCNRIKGNKTMAELTARLRKLEII